MNIRTKLTPIVKISILHNQLRLSSRSAGELQLILTESKNCVTRVTMNNPAKLNGWTVSMLESLFLTLDRLAEDTETRAVILTGSDPYYSAGASLSENITLMHPKKLHSLILENNEKLFNKFLDFPKPILVAANGPCIGASVTSALLCDGIRWVGPYNWNKTLFKGIIASEAATFLTPFARLSVPAEGCSSVHFPRTLGREAADKMLKQGAKIGALEALEIGRILITLTVLCIPPLLSQDWFKK